MIPQQQADAEMGMAAPGAFRARAARRLPPAHPQPLTAGVQMSRGPTAGVAPPTTMGMGMGAQMGATGMMPPGTAMRMPGGMAPPTAMGAPVMPGTGMAPGTGMRVGTAMMMQQGAPQDGARPMTSVNAAGFNSDPTTRVGQQFEPGNIASQSRGPAPALQKKSESSTEEKLKEMERQVNGLIEESAFEAAKGDSGSPAALEKAKEAAKKERVLCKQREVSPCRRGVAVLFVFSR